MPTMMGEAERNALGVVLAQLREALAHAPVLDITITPDDRHNAEALIELTTAVGVVGVNDEARCTLGLEVVKMLQGHVSSALAMHRARWGRSPED
jgi:hypothetical protein